MSVEGPPVKNESRAKAAAAAAQAAGPGPGMARAAGRGLPVDAVTAAPAGLTGPTRGDQITGSQMKPSMQQQQQPNKG